MWFLQRFAEYFSIANKEAALHQINLLTGPDSDLCPMAHFESGFWPLETELSDDNSAFHCAKSQH